MSLNCTTDKYDTLYAPWLGGAEDLLHLGHYLPGESLLDLCGGSGAVSKAALEKFPGGKPNITLFDLNPRPGEWAEYPARAGQLHFRRGKAEEVDRYLYGQTFDLVIIRQALGYLDIDKTFKAVAQVMKPGARLVFNSFIDPKEGVKSYSYKTYKFDGSRYFEAHFAFADRVLHLQARLTGAPGADVTYFKYHDAHNILEALKPWFVVKTLREGRGLRWVCIRKPFSYTDRVRELTNKVRGFSKIPSDLIALLKQAQGLSERFG